MKRTFDGPDAWKDAQHAVEKAGQPLMLTIDGAPYRLYPGGRVLCARYLPYHSFEGVTCDCDRRESGGTIATIRI